MNAPARPPRISRRVLGAFKLYCDFYYPRHIHKLLVSGAEHLRSSGPLVVYLNHPSWWDPITCLQLALRLMPQRLHYAPIDAEALKQYPFFRKLGFFGVQAGTLRGAREFVAAGEAILRDSKACLWITAQGRFADVRERPVKLMTGITHFEIPVVPLALEYTFLEERNPIALARFGEALGPRCSVAQLEKALTSCMDKIAEDAVARCFTQYQAVVSGAAGVGGFYDKYRWVKAFVSGKRFVREHGAVSEAKRRTAR